MSRLGDGGFGNGNGFGFSIELMTEHVGMKPARFQYHKVCGTQGRLMQFPRSFSSKAGIEVVMAGTA